MRIGQEILCLPYEGFSKHWPSGLMLSLSRNVCLSVCLSICPSVRLSVRPFTFEVTFKRFLPSLLEVGCPISLEIRNHWGKIMEKSGLRFEHFCLEVVLNRQKKKKLADFALQNKVETTLPIH